MFVDNRAQVSVDAVFHDDDVTIFWAEGSLNLDQVRVHRLLHEAFLSFNSLLIRLLVLLVLLVFNENLGQLSKLWKVTFLLDDLSLAIATFAKLLYHCVVLVEVGYVLDRHFVGFIEYGLHEIYL